MIRISTQNYKLFPTITSIFEIFIRIIFSFRFFFLPLHPNQAQMAESVDALVSNTSGVTHPGSTPGLGTLNYSESVANQAFATLFIFTASK